LIGVPGPRWFELDHARVVREHESMRAAFPAFVFTMHEGELAWEGDLDDVPAGTNAPALHVRVVCPSAFPIRSPRVVPLSPELPDNAWGHEWHRWREGPICIVRPSQWEPTYTVAQAVEKAATWYFNYVALTHGLIDAMPDVGRATIAAPAPEVE
jgi:hypothetical protein